MALISLLFFLASALFLATLFWKWQSLPVNIWLKIALLLVLITLTAGLGYLTIFFTMLGRNLP